MYVNWKYYEDLVQHFLAKVDGDIAKAMPIVSEVLTAVELLPGNPVISDVIIGLKAVTHLIAPVQAVTAATEAAVATAQEGSLTPTGAVNAVAAVVAAVKAAIPAAGAALEEAKDGGH
jgi:hypothetical protein